MYGIHGVVVGIVLRDNFPTVQDVFDTLVHKTTHADVDDTGNRTTWQNFQQCVAAA